MKWFMVVLVTFISQTALADTDHHEHGDHGKSKMVLTLNNGKKWATDPPLRKGMSAIHDHIKANLNKIQNHKMTDTEYRSLSKKIKGNIDTIFTACKLTPQADAQLHIVLAGMLSANAKVGGDFSTKEKASAVMEILGQFKAYLKHFDHSEAAKKS